MRKGRAARVALLFTAIVVGLPASAAHADEYVALGDSFAAGPVIPIQMPPFGCLKSSNNYGQLAALQLQVPIKDATCSGAKTNHMTTAQGVTPGPNPPQFDRLSTATTLVTLTIGGNDMGFSGIAENCFSQNGGGTPCQDHYVVNGVDEISTRIQETAPKVADVIQGIHTRSPNARVLVVNYAAILPHSGPGCWPVVPLSEGDVPYVRAKQEELNQMLATQAAANGAELVDWYAASVGHDACQPPGLKWVEAAVPMNAAAPVHPNLLGMIGAADLVIAAARAG
jgi:lysophospholipase L1-like esterase